MPLPAYLEDLDKFIAETYGGKPSERTRLNLEKQLPVIKFGRRKLVDTEEYWRRKKAEVQA